MFVKFYFMFLISENHSPGVELWLSLRENLSLKNSLRILYDYKPLPRVCMIHLGEDKCTMNQPVSSNTVIVNTSL